MKTCADFGLESECCSSCHHLEEKTGKELMVISRADGSPFAKVCCEMFEDVLAALAREEAISN